MTYGTLSRLLWPRSIAQVRLIRLPTSVPLLINHYSLVVRSCSEGPIVTLAASVALTVKQRSGVCPSVRPSVSPMFFLRCVDIINSSAPTRPVYSFFHFVRGPIYLFCTLRGRRISKIPRLGYFLRLWRCINLYVWVVVITTTCIYTVSQKKRQWHSTL